jgi:hypothetical protein
MKEMLKNKLYVSFLIADIISNFGDMGLINEKIDASKTITFRNMQ